MINASNLKNDTIKVVVTAIRFLFFAVFARIAVLFLLGLNVRHRQRLPDKGPAIIVTNNNDHLDTLILMTLLPLKILADVTPVASLDYFMGKSWLTWAAVNIFGLLAVDLSSNEAKIDAFNLCEAALENGKVLVFYPEGSRGNPEKMAQFKNAIATLAQRCPDVAVTPIFVYGLGKNLQKAEAMFAPYFCDIFVGETLEWAHDRKTYQGLRVVL